jgi:hypothetical protein
MSGLQFGSKFGSTQVHQKVLNFCENSQMVNIQNSGMLQLDRPCSSCWRRHLPREQFLSAPIHSPLSGRQFGPSSGIRDGYRSFRILTSLRSKDSVPGMGIGSSALRWKELPDVVEADGCFPSRQGSDPLGCYNEHILC